MAWRPDWLHPNRVVRPTRLAEAPLAGPEPLRLPPAPPPRPPLAPPRISRMIAAQPKLQIRTVPELVKLQQ
jgi:hypothetical protein